ncbi:MAG: hypothetical protein Q8N44_14240 [Rubrivivax sp.]|nr:hypothetical protein [Rubrivivax sp.]
MLALPASGSVPARDDTARPDPRSYRLDAADIQALVALAGTGAAASPAGDAKSPQPPQLPTPDQLGALLAPLLSVDHPSEGLFRAALRLSVCTEFKALLRKAAKAGDADIAAQMRDAGVDLVADCAPTADAAARANTAALQAGAAVPALYRQLMPGSLRETVVARALKLHPLQQPMATQWTAAADCGCAPDSSRSDVHAFASYWGSVAQQQDAAPAAKPVTREVDFSLMTRMSHVGAVLSDEADFDFPAPVRNQGLDLVRVARRHNAQVDLVIYRGRWRQPLPVCAAASSERDDFCRKAARNAIALIDAPATRPEGPAAWWPGSAGRKERAYDGLTLFFDNAPAAAPDGADPYAAFFKAFVGVLVHEMQRTGRPYHLNIVVPAAELGENGRYRFDEMVKTLHSAVPRLKRADPGSLDQDFEGKTPISVNYIVQVAEPAGANMKALRARIDQSTSVRGQHRVSLLRSLLPMLLSPHSQQPPWARQTPIKQFGDDLAYAGWNFGGAALWEPPSATAQPDMSKAVTDTVRSGEPVSWPALASFVCRHRLWLRVGLWTSVPLALLLFGVWRASDTLRRSKAS